MLNTNFLFSQKIWKITSKALVKWLTVNLWLIMSQENQGMHKFVTNFWEFCSIGWWLCLKGLYFVWFTTIRFGLLRTKRSPRDFHKTIPFLLGFPTIQLPLTNCKWIGARDAVVHCISCWFARAKLFFFWHGNLQRLEGMQMTLCFVGSCHSCCKNDIYCKFENSFAAKQGRVRGKERCYLYWYFAPPLGLHQSNNDKDGNILQLFELRWVFVIGWALWVALSADM